MTFECGNGRARITWSMFACACGGAVGDGASDWRQPGRSRGSTSASLPSRVGLMVDPCLTDLKVGSANDPDQRGLMATTRDSASCNGCARRYRSEVRVFLRIDAS